MSGDGASHPFRAKAWAPLAAALIIGALYIPRVDSNLYFLHGSETQGILLAQALAHGKGFVDLSLPGHPAHVREPPLFYLTLALIVKIWGLRMLPLKVLMWLGYVASAAMATVFFQRRSGGLTALSAAVMAMSAPVLFHFFTGPKSDVPYTAVSLCALLLIELTLDDASKRGRVRTALFAAATSGVIAAALTRTLGLSVLIAGAGALFLFERGRAPLKARFGRSLALLAPVTAAIGLWALRGARIPNPAGYTYLDWFLMDLPPDSPAMTAIDFHSPLAGPIPRIGLGGFMGRILHHLALYSNAAVGQVLDFARSGSPFMAAVVVVLLAALFAFGLWRSEKGRPPTVALYLAPYFAVMLVWPMDDPRLLLPLVPFMTFYLVNGLVELLDRLFKKRRVAILLTAATATALVGFNAYHDLVFQSHASRLPAMTTRFPGINVRFMNKAVMDSFQLLEWTADNAPPDAVIMYHSAPPCRFVTGHDCSPIPFPRDLADARDFIVNGGADYLVLDEWGKYFQYGPGWFVENVLRPVTVAYPSDFETVYEIPKTDAKVVRVKRR